MLCIFLILHCGSWCWIRYSMYGISAIWGYFIIVIIVVQSASSDKILRCLVSMGETSKFAPKVYPLQLDIWKNWPVTSPYLLHSNISYGFDRQLFCEIRRSVHSNNGLYGQESRSCEKLFGGDKGGFMGPKGPCNPQDGQGRQTKFWPPSR